MSPLAFAVRVVPLSALALVSAGIGAMALGDRIPSTWVMPLAILALLVFATLVTFRRARTWPAGLLLAFALLTGALLRLLLPELGERWPWALAGYAGIPAIGVPIGWRAGRRVRRMRWSAWAAAWAYILGWIGWQVLGLGQQMRLAWGIAGMIVFSGITITWASSLPARGEDEPEVSVAFELHLIGVNLGIAALLIEGG